jgi:hypothetical protein
VLERQELEAPGAPHALESIDFVPPMEVNAVGADMEKGGLQIRRAKFEHSSSQIEHARTS